MTRSTLALAGYVAFLAYQSLAAGGAWTCGGAVLAMPAHVSRGDLLANVVAYLPLGWLAALSIARTCPTRVALATSLGAAVSFGLELAQSCQADRVSSLVDWLANGTGAAAGAGTLVLVRRLTSRAVGRGHADAALRTVSAAGPAGWLGLGVAVLWLLAQTSPWVFTLDVGSARANLAVLARWPEAWPHVDGWRLLRHAAAWIAIACACRLAARGPLPAAALLCASAGSALLTQVLVQGVAPLSVEELAAVVSVVVLAVPLMLAAGAAPHPRRWPVAMFGAAVVSTLAYELQPGALPTTAAFSWWPRVGLGRLTDALDFALVFVWFGFTAVVAARAATDTRGVVPAWTWPVVAIALSLALEVAQLYVPGRGPDVSAPIFTALAVLATRASVSDDA